MSTDTTSQFSEFSEFCENCKPIRAQQNMSPAKLIEYSEKTSNKGYPVRYCPTCDRVPRRG